MGYPSIKTNHPLLAWLTIFSMLGTLGAACNDSQTNESTEGIPQALDPALEARYDAVRALHDEVMPERGNLVRLEREVRDAELEPDVAAVAKTRLAAADDAMMDWMHSDKSLTELDESMTTREIHAYLDERERSIRAVADSMAAAIAFARQHLAQ